MYIHVRMYPCRFKDAWSYAQALDSAHCWNELAEAAVFHLDIELGKVMMFELGTMIMWLALAAIRVYKHLKNVAMVYSLQEIQVHNYMCVCEFL